MQRPGGEAPEDTDVLAGHNRPKYSKRDIAFRGLMNCANDGCMLTGDVQKEKYVYYRSVNNTPEAAGLKTLGDLLRRLEKDPPPAFSMLRATCSLLGIYLNESTNDVLLDSVEQTRDGFRPFLKSRKYAGNSIRSSVNFRRILLKSAREFGWNPDAVPEGWRGVLALAAERKHMDIVKELARIRTTPGDVTIPDVDNWVQTKIGQGRSFSWANGRKRSLWRLLRDCGCDSAPGAVSAISLPTSRLHHCDRKDSD
jgi:hypothetical protein